MMSRFSKFFLAIITLGVALSASAANLVQVYQQAVQSDPTFKQAESTWMSARQDLPIAVSSYLPQATLGGAYARNFTKLTPTGGANNRNGWHTQREFTVQATQAIFNAAAWLAIGQADATVKAATATYFAAQQDLMLRTAQAYFAVLQAYDKLRYTLANKRAVYRQLVTARQKFKVGLIAITGVYDAQSVYDQAIADEIADRNSLENSIENLRAITGQHYFKLAGLGNSVPLMKPTPNNINSWVDIAEKQNYSLQAQRFTVLAAHRNIAATAATWLPTLSGEYDYQKTREHDHNNIPGGRVNNTSQSVSLDVSFPIFQGGSVYYNTKQARYNYVTASGQMEFTYRDVINQTRQAFLGVSSGISQIRADRQSIKSANNALEATKAGYVVGTRTMVDVLNDLSTLYQSQQKLADDQYSYILNIIQLKESAGTLQLTDLENLNKWLTRTIKMPVNKKYYRESSNSKDSPTIAQVKRQAHVVAKLKKHQRQQARQLAQSKRTIEKRRVAATQQVAVKMHHSTTRTAESTAKAEHRHVTDHRPAKKTAARRSERAPFPQQHAQLKRTAIQLPVPQ